MQSWIPLIAPITAFLAVVLAAAGFYQWRLQRADQVNRRLYGIQGGGSHTAGGKDDGQFIVRVLQPAGGMILPNEEWRRSALQAKLVRAGFRHDNAVYILLGLKVVGGTALALTVPVVATLTGHPLFTFQWEGLSLAALLAFVGFFLPEFVLANITRRRQREFVEGFPDALDMLVVCVEAGLGLDAAIDRVAREMRHSHRALASELALHSMEVRAGKSRQEAFQALADRMEIEQVHSMSSTLVQAERFGTSVASALRNFADEMRVQRIQRARQIAARLPVKMIFPIVLCIFPAMFLVLLGPALVRIFTSNIFGG